MIFLILYDRYCARYRDKKNVFFPFALTCLAHCVMALVTEITVNMDGISPNINDTCHILFFFFSLLYSLLYLDYVLSLILPKGNYRKNLLLGGCVICLVCVIFMSFSPIYYLQGNGTRYSAGLGPTLCYGLGFFFMVSADILILVFRDKMDRSIPITILPLSVLTLGLLMTQILIPEFLYTAQSLTITAVGLFFAIENPLGKFQKQAFVDAYLNIRNRNSYEYDLNHIIAEKLRNEEDLIYVIGDVNGLKTVNDTLSHGEGDTLLETAAGILQEKLSSAYRVYRIGGDEFAAFYFGKDLQTVERETALVTEACSRIKMRNDVPVGISIGYAARQKGEALTETAARADAMMYEKKRAYYAAHGNDRRRGR